MVLWKLKQIPTVNHLEQGLAFSKCSGGVNLLLFLHKMYSSKEEIGSFVFILPFTLSNSMILFSNELWIRIIVSRGDVPLPGMDSRWPCQWHPEPHHKKHNPRKHHAPHIHSFKRSPVSSLPFHPDDPVWASSVENICIYHCGTVRVGRAIGLLQAVISHCPRLLMLYFEAKDPAKLWTHQHLLTMVVFPIRFDASEKDV